MKLLTHSNPKTLKGEGWGYRTAIMHLAPFKLSGYGKSVCPAASKGCVKVCLNTSGMSQIGGDFDLWTPTPKVIRAFEQHNIHRARIARTRLFWDDRTAFLEKLHGEIGSFIKLCTKKSQVPCIRLNGTSDLSWEAFGVPQKWPGVQFYDYTKVPGRMKQYLECRMPANYHVTFSRTEDNHDVCLDVLKRDGNVAVVFFGGLPRKWEGYKVISGDHTDLRFLDPEGVVVGLTAKARAKKDHTGFTIRR